VTTDLANLWRAKEAGMLQPVSTPRLESQVPSEYRDPDEEWWGMSLRIRTPMRSTERVGENAITSYEDLGNPQFRGKLCLRTSNNEYNQSFVADRIAKRGAADTEKLLRSWMANEPQIFGSDVDVLEAIAAGRCDVGLTNHYYLGRILKDKPDFPVAPAWPDQDGAGAHTNLSGVALVKGTEHKADAVSLMEYLTSPPAQEEVVKNSELAANPDVAPPEHIRDWADVKRDPIDVERAGKLLPDAIALMQKVGWK
jgi:iron(III) transport system substrate-binding protein